MNAISHFAVRGISRFFTPQWLILAGTLLIAVLTAANIVALNKYSDNERVSETRLAMLESYLYQLSLVEETAAAEHQAGHGIQEKQSDLYQRIDVLYASLTSDADLKGVLPKLGHNLAAYRNGLHIEFGLITSSKFAQAEDVARTTVDPPFDQLCREIDIVQGISHRDVEKSNRTADAGTIAALALAAVVTTLLFRRYERVRLEAANHAQSMAEQANRGKSEFLSRMSHELRTPMNSVLGFAQLLQLGDLDESAKSDVTQILRAGKHLLALIDEVLDIARIDAGKLQISLEPVRISDVVDEVVQMMSPIADQRGISIQCDVDACWECYIMVDRQRIKQVLLNLISNAVKYNFDEGSVTIDCAETVNGAISLTVTDTGRGIPQELTGRLFSPFDRLDAESTGIEGTGLGLSLTKRLVELMGGKIGVKSEVGAGSQFSVEVAQACRPEQRLEEVTPTEHPVAKYPDAVRHNVLYIEDNEANLDLVEAIFKRRPGLCLMTAVQGRLGIDLAREHRPDLILLDLNLPDISGKQVLKSLRDDPQNSDTPIVMISADAMSGRNEELITAGATAYLTKPIIVEELLSVVDDYLNAA